MAVQKGDRFEKVFVESGSLADNYMAIYVDKVTGVNYLFSSSGYAGGLTVLLNRDGTPVVTPIAKIYGE